MVNETAIERAIRLAGGVAALGRKLNESTQTVSNWRQRGEAPANKCAAIEAVTGVSRIELRADWRDYWPELECSEHRRVDVGVIDTGLGIEPDRRSGEAK